MHARLYRSSMSSCTSCPGWHTVCASLALHRIKTPDGSRRKHHMHRNPFIHYISSVKLTPDIPLFQRGGSKSTRGKKTTHSFKSSKTKKSNFLKFQKMMFTVFSGKKREDREIKRRRKPESRNSSDAPGFSSSCIRILFFSFFCCFSVSLRFGSFSFGSLMERVIITQRVETKQEPVKCSLRSQSVDKEANNSFNFFLPPFKGALCRHFDQRKIFHD